MFLEKLKEIIKSKEMRHFFWIFIGLWFFGILFFGHDTISLTSVILFLIFLFIFLLPFFIVKKKYKELNWEKFILCFLFSLIHIFILCFIIGVSIGWIFNFDKAKMGNILFNIYEYMEFIFLISFIIGFLLVSVFIIIPSPFYFVWKKYKKFTKKRIIICSLTSLILVGLCFYSWAFGTYFLFYLGLDHIFITK
ncbi:hypothetical protein HY750_01280 [Candidatus Kuenenbacteria bacterium]|nr:hypothetical protein [Candidatus Kuenenbacteria bacterium]